MMIRKGSDCSSLRRFTLVNGPGTSRWGEFGEGGLLWEECNGKSFEWFDGNPVEELLCKILDGIVRPTWKLIDGVCKESLAFETAQREGLPEIIIDRARELYISVNAIDKTTVDVNHVNPMFHVKDLSKVGDSSMAETLQVLQEEVENAIKVIRQERLTELYKKNTLDSFELKCIAIGRSELPPPSTVCVSCI